VGIGLGVVLCVHSEGVVALAGYCVSGWLVDRIVGATL